MSFEFGKVLDRLRDRAAVRREGWPDGQRIMLVPGSQFKVEEGRPLGEALGEVAIGRNVFYGAHIDLVTNAALSDEPAHSVVVWNGPTVADLLAGDWEDAPPEEASWTPTVEEYLDGVVTR